MSTLGRKTGSSIIGGSRDSVYSNASTVRTGGHRGASSLLPRRSLPWYKKPLVSHALYTNLQRGSWHIGFYCLFISLWTILLSIFDIYCLEEAKPGSSHTGYYIISFDFVYVGNPHIRNLLILTNVINLLLGFALLVTTAILLDGLRKEEEGGFRAWLITMAVFTSWRIFAWVFVSIVNDIIFIYHILMFILWIIYHVLNVYSWICIYSLYLELMDLTKLQNMTRLKMDTMSLPASRAASMYGSSRPTSPYTHQGTLDSRQQEELLHYSGRRH